MITDISTVLWKEWREYLAGDGRGRGRVIVLIWLAIVCILPPIQAGAHWASSPLPVILDVAILPIMVLLTVVADSFAGERERHTLETLLASRLSDRAILFGKVAASTGYGWGLGLVAAVLQLVVANLVHSESGLQLYSVSTALIIIVLGLLMATLGSTAGCLVSLRATTVRQAQQVSSIGFFLILLARLYPFGGMERVGVS